MVDRTPAGRPVLAVEDAPDPDDVAFLEAKVVESTLRSAGIDDDRDLAIFVREPDGEIVAGVSGGTWGGCCELSHLWVDDAARGQGLGSALVRAAEDEARHRGCTCVVLFTHDVQAPGFYERLGYETVGVVDDYPVGSAARWFRKQLSCGASPAPAPGYQGPSSGG
jgi:ribosomal protein S18 acetylase RimI-like enzyme